MSALWAFLSPATGVHILFFFYGKNNWYEFEKYSWSDNKFIYLNITPPGFSNLYSVHYYNNVSPLGFFIVLISRPDPLMVVTVIAEV